MKRKLLIYQAVATAAWIALPTGATDADSTTTDNRDAAAQPPAVRLDRANRWDRLGPVEKASDLIGMQVKNNQNQNLGKVDELGVDLGSGRVVSAILSVGGFLGVGDTLVAIPPRALHLDAPNKVLHLDADKDRLKAAPRFDMAKWDEAWDSNRVSEVYRYYGQQPYFANESERERIEKTMDPDKMKNRDRNWRSRGAHASTALGQVSRASKVIGMPVTNLQDEKLGKVDNLMVDLGAGRVVAAVISSGGFLGIGNELSAVPLSVLRSNSKADGFVIDATKDSLARAPHFNADQWPDFSQPAYTETIYRSYRVEPYFGTTRTDTGKMARNTRDADNTGRNVRDRKDRTLTPLDQGNNDSDIATTSRIRKAIVADKTMSVSARNVKIITVHGRVTLRGPVKSEDEKRRIEEIARSVSGADNVESELELKENR